MSSSGHDLSSNLPWVMTAASPQAASNANVPLVDAIGGDGQLAAQRRRRGKPHRHPPDLARAGDADEAQEPMGAHRHGAQAVGEQEVEAGRPRRVDIEVMCRPVAGHLGVAAGHLLVCMQCR